MWVRCFAGSLAIDDPLVRTPHDARYPTTRIGGALSPTYSPPTGRGEPRTAASRKMRTRCGASRAALVASRVARILAVIPSCKGEDRDNIEMRAGTCTQTRFY